MEKDDFQFLISSGLTSVSIIALGFSFVIPKEGIPVSEIRALYYVFLFILYVIAFDYISYAIGLVKQHEDLTNLTYYIWSLAVFFALDYLVTLSILGRVNIKNLVLFDFLARFFNPMEKVWMISASHLIVAIVLGFVVNIALMTMDD